MFPRRHWLTFAAATLILPLAACTSTTTAGRATSTDPASDRTHVLALAEEVLPVLADAFDADYWSCRGDFRSTTFTETSGRWYRVQAWLTMDEVDPPALADAFADAGFEATPPTNPHHTVSATQDDITLSASIYYEHRQLFEFASPVHELPEYTPLPAEYDELPVCGDTPGNTADD